MWQSASSLFHHHQCFLRSSDRSHDEKTRPKSTQGQYSCVCLLFVVPGRFLFWSFGFGTERYITCVQIREVCCYSFTWVQMFGDQTNLPESLSKNRTCKPTCSSLASMFSSKNEANFILTVQIHCLYRLSFHVCLEESDNYLRNLQ